MKFIRDSVISKLKTLTDVSVLGDAVSVKVYDSHTEDLEGDLLDKDFGCYIPYDDVIKINLECFENQTEDCLMRVLRHEIIHAFMFKSSFQLDLYPVDEEFTTEWFAQMWPRINEVFVLVQKILGTK